MIENLDLQVVRQIAEKYNREEIYGFLYEVAELFDDEELMELAESLDG
jgi:hypothetical protein